MEPQKQGMEIKMDEIGVYIIAKPGDKIEIRNRKTDEKIFPQNVNWDKFLSKEDWNKCRDGLTIYETIYISCANCIYFKEGLTFGICGNDNSEYYEKIISNHVAIRTSCEKHVFGGI